MKLIRDVFKKYREFCVFSILIYLFMNVYFPLQRSPYQILYTCAKVFFPILEALQKIIFCDLVLRCRLYLLNPSVAQSFHGALKFGNKKKSREYGGCGITSVLFLVKNSRTSYYFNFVQFLSFHKSRRFWRIASRNLRIKCRQPSHLTELGALFSVLSRSFHWDD